MYGVWLDSAIICVGMGSPLPQNFEIGSFGLHYLFNYSTPLTLLTLIWVFYSRGGSPQLVSLINP